MTPRRIFARPLKKIRDMGYDGVEFAGLYGNSPADIKAMLDEIGLTAVSAHVPLRICGVMQRALLQTM